MTFPVRWPNYNSILVGTGALSIIMYPLVALTPFVGKGRRIIYQRQKNKL